MDSLKQEICVCQETIDEQDTTLCEQCGSDRHYVRSCWHQSGHPSYECEICGIQLYRSIIYIGDHEPMPICLDCQANLND